ncbi:HNH endonuclease [Edwardsiella tarda]|uniref:HNH endonuclease n=1 Tax=Edwardsiella tarda TaxID=636 RepID=A0A2A7U2W1_EDWTA|nr:HNH endonuclease [Edwardsiella tarda]PEH72621.1 HNH endonuclease [Edwardsiella tarda]
MKYLGELVENQPCTWLEVAKNSRKNSAEQLRLIAEDMSECYSLYEGLISSHNEELPVSLFLQHSEMLIDYYENSPSKLKKLLFKRRSEHELDFCPFCGNPKTPDTLDHFIPKKGWPEFSIFPNNLVPQCRECAPIKGDGYYCNESNSVMYVHPFYFNFLDNFRFYISVSLNTDGDDIDVSVTLRVVVETQDSDKSRIKLHAKSLKIKNRVINYCNKEFRQWKRRLSKNNFDIRCALQQRLLEWPQADVGKNWQSAFYYALLQNQEVIDYMNSLCPSKNMEQQFNDETMLELN